MKEKFYLFIFLLPIFLAAFIVAQTAPEAELSIEQFVEVKSNDPSLIVLDVRNDYELEGELGMLDDIVNISFWELPDRLEEIEKFKLQNIAVICHSGPRSAKATEFLNKNGYSAKNVVGGMKAYREFEKEHNSL